MKTRFIGLEDGSNNVLKWDPWVRPIDQFTVSQKAVSEGKSWLKEEQKCAINGGKVVRSIEGERKIEDMRLVLSGEHFFEGILLGDLSKRAGRKGLKETENKDETDNSTVATASRASPSDTNGYPSKGSKFSQDDLTDAQLLDYSIEARTFMHRVLNCTNLFQGNGKNERGLSEAVVINREFDPKKEQKMMRVVSVK